MDAQTKLLAPLTFNQGNLAQIGNDSGSTGFAIGIIFLNALISGALAAFGDGGAQLGFLLNTLGVASTAVAAVFIFMFVFQLLFLIFISWGIKVAVGLFGGKASTMEVLRMIGFATIWSIIGTVIVFILPSLGIINTICSILFIVAVAIGLGASAQISPIVAFIACIVGLIISVIVLFIFALVLALALSGVINSLA